MEPSPCDTETEVCSNLIGSFKCKCKDGLVRSKDGTCAPEETAPKKTKKKKKSKGNKEVEEDLQRIEYSWYYMVAPFALLIITTKYCRPNMATSIGIILFVALSAKVFSG